MTKGLVGRVCGLGAVCCIALAGWSDRSNAGVQTPARFNTVTPPKPSPHAIGSADKHQLTGKALTAKPAPTAKHAAKSDALKHGTAKASHAKHTNSTASHASLDSHRHGRAKHGVSTTTGPGKKFGYSIAPPVKR